MKQRIFISSMQKEFARERKKLGKYLAKGKLFPRHYETFLFERDVPASDRRPDAVYLDEVNKCDLYLGLFGNEYGKENGEGLSPTHIEFNEATRLEKTRLIFVKGATDDGRHPKMKKLIRKCDGQLIRRRFKNYAELQTAVDASLIDHLESIGVINDTSWGARAARKASLDDLEPEAIVRFVRRARKARNFPLAAESEIKEVLTHLNLLNGSTPTNAAILLFGKCPQRFTLSSEVKCAHFHGTRVAKPIPSHQVYKGTAFELVDQAIDFVMSKINLSVGTREHGPQAPVEYEIPREVVAEAIVNAVVHRDYNSNGSVQVMLFSDRLEVWNPGTLPPALTLAKLLEPHSSIPGNPLLAEPLYLTKYIERMGTGTRDMIARCQEAGLSDPEFTLTDGFVATIRRPDGSKLANKFSGIGTAKNPAGTKLGPSWDQAGTKLGLSRDQVGTKQGPSWDQAGTKLGLSRDQVEIIRKCLVSQPIIEIMKITGRTNRTKFRDQVLRPLLDNGLVEMAIPDKPRSSKQQYRITPKGRAVLEANERVSSDN